MADKHIHSSIYYLVCQGSDVIRRFVNLLAAFVAMNSKDDPIGHPAGIANALEVPLEIRLVNSTVSLKAASQHKPGRRIFSADPQCVSIEQMNCRISFFLARTVCADPPRSTR